MQVYECEKAKVHVSLFQLFRLLSNISWARSSHFETCCSTLRHIVWCWVILHTSSLPRSPWQALSCSVKTVNEIECLTCRQAVQLRDILSDLETCLTTAKTLVTRLHASSLIFPQDNQWTRMSNLRQVVQLRGMLSDLETCLTQNCCQNACNKIACKLSHLLWRMSMSSPVWLWDRAVAIWQNITRLGIGTIKTWILMWNTFSVNVPINHLGTEQSSRVRISRKFVSKNFKVFYWFCIKYLNNICHICTPMFKKN